MEQYKVMYERLHEEFERYQSFAEKQMQRQNEKIIKLESNLDAFANIIEINKYMNSYISDDNLMAMINDMILGVLGVNYSTIYLFEDGNFIVKATNTGNYDSNLTAYDTDCIKLEEGFIMNSIKPLFINNAYKDDIHSVIGVPIKIRKKFLGYIIVEHTYFKFFNPEHIKFISSIANQIAIVIETSSLYKRVEEAAKRDPLLSIYNRKYFFEVVDKKIVYRKEEKFAIVMSDIDNFKGLNDNYGHQFGDEALQHITKILLSNLNPTDMVARYGGEELVIYLDDFKSEYEIVERVDSIRKQLAETPICKNGDIVPVTLSFGVSFYPLDGDTSDSLLKIADINLYKAKNTGKNKVVSSH